MSAFSSGPARAPVAAAAPSADSAVGTQGPLDAEALFRAHARAVSAFVQRLGVPGTDVHDLVQDVFLVAHRKGGYQPGPAQPRTWLCAIAVRLAQASHRTRARGALLDPERVEGASSAACDPERQLQANQALARVQRALDTLDIEHRGAFLLYEVEGESCDQIASALEVPIGTVYSRLHYARRRFLAAYAAAASGGPGPSDATLGSAPAANEVASGGPGAPGSHETTGPDGVLVKAGRFSSMKGGTL